MRSSIIMALIAGLWTASLAFAAPVIDVGTITLQANKPGQIVPVLVSGGDPVTGFNLRAQIGDGINPSPIFQSISFAGGIWDAHPSTTTGNLVAGFDEYAQLSVAFNTNVTVPATGVLTMLTIDTTGITTDSVYALKLSGVELIGQDSDLLLSGGSTLTPTIKNGTLHVVVPEPSALGLLGIASVMVCLRRRWVAHD